MLRLPDQLPDEQIVKILRRDIVILVKKIFLFMMLVLFFLLFAFIMYTQVPEIQESDIFPALVLGSFAYFLFAWLFFFFSFIDFYLNVVVITNERIINIEQQGFFSRTISEQRLFRIQDVTSEVVGVWPTVFKYGKVYVQTAAEKERFIFEQIPDPNGVRDLLIKLAETDRERAGKELLAEEKFVGAI